MRQFNAIKKYPEPKEQRYVDPRIRTIKSRIIASYRDQEYYDGDRKNGYGAIFWKMSGASYNIWLWLW